MKGLVILLIILLITCIIYLGITQTFSFIKKFQSDRARWEIDERSDGEQVVIRITKIGEDPLLIGAAAFAAPDFEFRIEELRSTARYKLIAINQKSLSK